MGKKNKRKYKQKQPPDKMQERSPLPKTHDVTGKPKRKLLFCFILFVLVAAVYGPSIKYNFTLDDAAVVSENRFVQQGFDGIKHILTSQYFAGYDLSASAMAYRPVPLISYAIEYSFFGLDPGAFHATNILLYSLTCIILLITLSRLFGKEYILHSFIVCILFAIHPIHTEVVASIKNRDEMLGFLNFILAVLFLFRFLDQPLKRNLFLSLIFYFLALASKESMLTTIALIPLLIYFFRSVPIKRILRITLPFAAVLVVFLLIRFSVIGAGHVTSQIRYLDNPLLAAHDLNTRIGTNISVMGMYLQSIIFPAKLSCDYSYNSIPLRGISDPTVLGWLIVYTLLIIAAIRGFRKKSIYSFSIAWFLISISIFSSIFILSSNAYADRFLYLPSFSICLLVGSWIFRITGKKESKKVLAPWKIKTARTAGIILSLLIAGSSIYRISTYLPSWNDNLSLFTYNTKVNPLNSRVHRGLGGEYIRMANAAKEDSTKRKQLAKEGIKELEKAISIYPSEAEVYTNLGAGYILTGDFANAEKELKTSLELNPNYKPAFSNLGYIYYMSAHYKEAADTWEKIDPGMRNKSDYLNLYLAYKKLGDEQKAAYYKGLSEK